MSSLFNEETWMEKWEEMIATIQPISSIPTGVQYYIYDSDYNISEIHTTVLPQRCRAVC